MWTMSQQRGSFAYRYNWLLKVKFQLCPHHFLDIMIYTDTYHSTSPTLRFLIRQRGTSLQECSFPERKSGGLCLETKKEKERKEDIASDRYGKKGLDVVRSCGFLGATLSCYRFWCRGHQD